MKVVLIAIALVAACGGAKTAATTATVKLELGELKIVDVNKNVAFLVHANGDIELEGKTGVKVTTDGKIIRTDNGAIGFVLNSDGTIRGPSGDLLPALTLSTDGVITSNGKTITVDAAGLLVGGNPDAPQLKIEGATTVGLRRTALFVMIAVLTPDESK